MQRPIENHLDKGGLVYDPFLGSGTTVIAAQRTGRICFGLELDPAYVDVIVRRWQNFTGKDAKLEGTNQTFKVVEAVVSDDTAPREAKTKKQSNQ